MAKQKALRWLGMALSASPCMVRMEVMPCGCEKKRETDDHRQPARMMYNNPVWITLLRPTPTNVEKRSTGSGIGEVCTTNLPSFE
jgi:hypothetical protein